MKTRRWLVAATEEAARCEVQMPWSRGARREAFIAKREGTDSQERASA